MAMTTATIEYQLIDKLFRNHHLNVVEREKLPRGGLRLSACKKVIADQLKLHGVYPGRCAFDAGEFIQLRMINGCPELWIGCERSAPTSTEFHSQESAIEEFLSQVGKAGLLDGIRLDRTA